MTSIWIRVLRDEHDTSFMWSMKTYFEYEVAPQMVSYPLLIIQHPRGIGHIRIHWIDPNLFWGILALQIMYMKHFRILLLDPDLILEIIQ